jgi:multidrug efflux pump
MSLSTPFIRRPVATSLLTAALALAGAIAFRFLPVSPLPQVEFPTIQVSAGLPGASPETMASSVATPLERQFGRIAGITEMTSTSSLGSTSITLQFDLNRNIDAAGRDVQAAINAARGQLPANLPSNPNYRKTNPADAPVMILSMTSSTMEISRLYDIASTVLQQKLSQVEGVGQVIAGGAALPAVRVELNPLALNRYGIGLEQVRTVLGAANANRPKGQLADDQTAWEISTTDQLLKAREYRPLIVEYRQGGAVRIMDIATVEDSVENLRNMGLSNGIPAVLLIVFRQPGANIIETVDRVRVLLPVLKASIPASIQLNVLNDRTTTIRASVHDVEISLIISISLVVLVVFLFLRNVWATLIPSIVVPLSLVGTFGVMYLFNYSIDNLSLMALTISTGFVVDDAIVVIENIIRHLERGLTPMQAALQGAREIGFTVLSMSTSLVAVFIPILLMGGIVGRLFREFAITLSAAISVSLVVSLTTTPMMCARLLKSQKGRKHGVLYQAGETAFDLLLRGYARGLTWVLRHPRTTMAISVLTVCLNVYLYQVVPKGFFPQQDTGRMMGAVQAAQDSSYQALREKFTRFVHIVLGDPAVRSVGAFMGGNSGRMFVELKPLGERRVTADEVIARLRKKLDGIPGASLFLQSVQDIRVGGRMSNAQFQYTLRGDNLKDLNDWAPRVLRRLREIPQLADVNSDQQDRGLEASLLIDRDTASRLGVTAQVIDNTLYDAFGQRQVSTLYAQLNQYHVVMEVAPQYWQNPETLQSIYVPSSTGQLVPLSAITHYTPSATSLSVNHQGQFPSITISFNLAPKAALGDAVRAIESARHEMGLPITIQASFQGTAQAFQDSLANMPLLILAALVAVYIVLGILYESYIHPITILSTLPSAGVGAILALLLCHMELTVIALIGIILLIGIVKKNAILMIDFALAAERKEGKNPQEAIYAACLLRFRPIMMTTMAALLGGLPLALGSGVGSELRRPLGVTIVGGLIVSQMLTLFTTPIVYLYLDQYRLWWARLRAHADILLHGADAKGETS